MDRAIDQGGAPAGRMLARKVALVAEPFEEVRLAALRLLESWRAEGAPARLAFADTLRRGPRTPEVAPLARAAVRAISRDSGRLGARMEAADFRHLAAFAGDGPCAPTRSHSPSPRRPSGSRATSRWRSRSPPATPARWRPTTPRSSPTA